MNLRGFILHASIPVTKVMGKIGFWWVKRYVDACDVAALRPLLRPGDALLSIIRWELSNVFIEGDWGHEAIYAGDGLVVEAVGSGVRIVTLKQFMKGKDYVAAFRPKFATPAQGMDAARWCVERAHEHLPYDFLFTFSKSNNRAFYCAELYGAAYLAVIGDSCAFLERNVMGSVTFIPQDTANAVDKFDLVGASRRTFTDGILKKKPASAEA